ncbi:MAG: hypothetical protein K9G70_12595 [Prolixibacteraceae bacterium]|nr:hypothetical protein [Prolixibacteraceae bacterium]
MKKIDPNKKILLDADVIIHFCKANSIGILPTIYPNKYFIPDIVYREALSVLYKTEIDNLLNFKMVEELQIKTEMPVYREYIQLIKQFGKGESACMAYCKFHKDVIGSSNLKDITRYCHDNDIVYLTTMDFLVAAFETGVIDEAACDLFINEVKSKNSKLPVNTIREYLYRK